MKKKCKKIKLLKDNNGFEFIANNSDIKIHKLEVHGLKSIWPVLSTAADN